MRNSDANIFLDVDPYINELIHSRLIPMFMDDVDWNDIESISQVIKNELCKLLFYRYNSVKKTHLFLLTLTLKLFINYVVTEYIDYS